MIAKHLHSAKNVAGSMAVVCAERAARSKDEAEVIKFNQKAHELADLAVEIDALMRKSVELMAS